MVSGLTRVVYHSRSSGYPLVPVIRQEEQDQGQEHERAVEKDTENQRHGMGGKAENMCFCCSGTGSSLKCASFAKPVIPATRRSCFRVSTFENNQII